MEDPLAEACLRNVARLVNPGGILVVDGVDLDLKARVMPARAHTDHQAGRRSVHRRPVQTRLAVAALES